MKAAMPPERWTPKGEDPQEHYRRIFAFERDHFSSKTIYNVFWSTNNYSMPDPVPKINTKIEYWYLKPAFSARGVTNEAHMLYYFQYFKAGVLSLLKRWLDQGCPEPPSEIAEMIVQLINR